jgi:hypothetical protein
VELDALRVQYYGRQPNQYVHALSTISYLQNLPRGGQRAPENSNVQQCSTQGQLCDEPHA